MKDGNVAVYFTSRGIPNEKFMLILYRSSERHIQPGIPSTWIDGVYFSAMCTIELLRHYTGFGCFQSLLWSDSKWLTMIIHPFQRNGENPILRLVSALEITYHCFRVVINNLACPRKYLRCVSGNQTGTCRMADICKWFPHSSTLLRSCPCCDIRYLR
jgi:hypothetical protein